MIRFFLAASILMPQIHGEHATPQEKPAPSQGEVRITILYDNLAATPELTTGWGFAALLETSEHTLLFDTGADGQTLLENMQALGKDPARIEAVLISHAHSDHTGGLQALLELGVRPTLYLLPGFPASLREMEERWAQVVVVEPGQEIVPGIFTTGQVGVAIPEQALAIATPEGGVVLTGCAHPGPVEMAARAQEVLGTPLHAVMGGFHLTQAGEDVIQQVIHDLRELGVQRAGPTHCSGDLAMVRFREALGDGFIPMGVGRILAFRLPGRRG